MENVLGFTGYTWIGGTGNIGLTQWIWKQGGGMINSDLFWNSNGPTISISNKIRYNNDGGANSPASSEAKLEAQSGGASNAGLCEIFA